MKNIEAQPSPRLPVGHQRGINWIMPVYFVTGLVGTLFLSILLLRDIGCITFEPYEYYVTQYVLLMGLGLFMGFGWILGIVAIVLYRRNWSVITPALLLVAVRLISTTSSILANFGVALPFLAEAEYIAMYFYCISALLIGGGWLFSRIVHLDSRFSKH